MKTNEKILSLILALALILGAAPLTALAEDDLSMGTSLGASGHITAFAELDDDLRWQRDYTPKLPETLEATVNGGPAQVPVTWEAEGYNPASFTQSGLFMFYAAPGEGYTLAEGVSAPKITVLLLPKVSFFMAGMGDAANPLKITRADQLAEVAELVNDSRLESLVGQAPVYLRLENNITLTGEWTPIGTATNPFKGHFDGNNLTISGLKITVDTYAATGLFGVVKGGSVRNLRLADVDIQGDAAVGGVAGYVGGGDVENCCVTGKVGGTSDVGGVAGYVAAGGSVTGCYSKATASGSGSYIGGVAGYVEGSVESCYSTGAVNGNGSGSYGIGGVAGFVETGGSVKNCYSTGAVSGSFQVGGVAGTVHGGSATNCYSTGAVSGSVVVGGVAGYVYGGSVTDCAALNPSVEATLSDVGRVVGYIYNSPTLNNNVAFDGILNNSGNSSWSNPGAGGLDGEGITAADIRGSIGERFPLEYWLTHAQKLPTLVGLDGQDQQMPAHLSSANIGYFSGGGSSSGDPYLIGTEAQLKSLAGLVNAGIGPYANPGVYYKLTADITLTGEWTAIGTLTNPFKGSFDGDDHTIYGLTINKPTADYQGLFGYVIMATSAVRIENVHLADCDITGGDYVGGIAGYISTSSCVINCSVSGKVAGYQNVGGIAGTANNSVNIEKSFTACDVTAATDNAGGIAGLLSGSNVTGCYTTGDVTSAGNAGGIAGRLTGSITSCYSTGSIYGENIAGGIAGKSTGTITDCAALNPSVESGSPDSAGRVFGSQDSGYFPSGNVAFEDMEIFESGASKTSVGNIGTHKDGANKTATEINGDGTIDSLFTTTDGWTPQNGMLPGLMHGPVEMPFHLKIGNYFGGGDGTSEAEAYEIATVAQLKNLARLVNAGDPDYNNKHYKLTADLTLTGEWTPIGHTDNTAFKGHFDGGYHTISGLKITSGYYYAGLFGVVDGGSLKNLGLVDVDVSGGYAGGVAGSVGNSGSVESCYVTGAVSGTGDAGGVAGGVYGNGSVTNCYSTATVSGTGDAGGVAGFVRNGGSVTNCYSTGAVNGTSTSSGVGYGIGGVAGFVDDGGSVENCAALNPSVKDTGMNAEIGRVVGYKDATGTLSDNYGFEGMRGTFADKTGNGLDGADMTKIQAVTPSFWTGTMVWDDSVWTLAQGKLPILTGFLDQDGEPGLYLTGLPTDDLTIMPDSTTLTRSASPQMVDFSVTGMEDWTHPLIEWSATAGGSMESTVNGEATLTVAANYAGVITVTAENKNSGKTAIATVTVITVPGAPTNVTATPGNGQVTLNWSAPDVNGGAAVIRYEVAGNLVVWASVPSSETSYTFTGLTNGTEYTFKIRAVNVVGNGLEATVTATPGASATVPVTGVTLDLYTLTLLAQGDTQALTATVLPANATNQAVTWRSSDTAVATVDASGTVAGIAEGTATVTATTVDGGFTADCAVTVLPEDAVIVPVTGVSVHPASVSIKPGNTRQITATVSPADATIRDISWRSSDLTVATVDGYGKVTAVALGRATITATTRDGGFTATCAVTVTYETGGYTTGGSSGDSSRSGIDYAVQQGVYWIEQAEAKTLAGSAREKVESLVRTRRSASTGIRKAALEALAGLKYEHDTVADSAVQVRVRIDEPEKLAKDTLVSGYAKGDDVDGIRSIFEKWFENKVRVIHLDQQEDWGAPVKLAAKVDLTGMDTKNLYLYAYDKKTNTYRRIEKPAYWIDQNGYLRFTTEYAGDIIICEGPLERK